MSVTWRREIGPATVLQPSSERNVQSHHGRGWRGLCWAVNAAPDRGAHLRKRFLVQPHLGAVGNQATEALPAEMPAVRSAATEREQAEEVIRRLRRFRR